MSSIVKSSEMPADIKFVNGMTSSLFGVFVLLLILSGSQYVIKNKIKNLDAITIRGDVFHNDISSISDNISNKIFGNFYNVDLKKTKQVFESTPWVSHAVVKRVYPSQIEVTLSEYKSKAIWGAREDVRLVDDTGKIFEVGADEDEYESLPQLIGSDGQGKLMLDMYKEVSSALHPIKGTLRNLELNARGSWIATLEGGAHIELGRGNTVDVINRVVKFSMSVEKILTKLNKKSLDIQYVDLRHSDGYAMRVHGVSTLDSTLATASLKSK
jgi:cell division protein FtsQ